MRARLAAITLPLMSLTACGGGGQVFSAGSSAGAGGSFASGSVTTTDTTANSTNLFDVANTTAFEAIGAFQTLTIQTSGETLYRGNATTATAPNGTITYNPRDGIFTVNVSDTAAGVSRNITFQDPAHRATADVARIGEYQVPLLAGFNYLQALDGKAQFTFFYQRPGVTGAFVSLAGFERSETTDDGTFTSQQGVMVFGSKTTASQLPSKGAATFNGQFLATMSGALGPSVPILQWINGTSSAQVDFDKRTVGLSLTGTVGPAFTKLTAISDANLAIPSGSTFTANASASWTQGGTAFAGKFNTASFKTGTRTSAVDFTSVSAGGSVAGASSVDGTFYGPKTNNIGGNFRIVGGVPNQRVDILGAFVGAQQ
jgi:hypothetical protein